MNQLSRIAMISWALAASFAASAAEITITIKSGESSRAITRPLSVGQAIEIDERKSVDFKAIEGCEGISITGPATSVVTGLHLTIDAVQEAGDAYFLQISYQDSSFDGKRTEQYRPGCKIHWPQTTVSGMAPAFVMVPKSRKEPVEVFKTYTAASGKQTSLNLQIK